MVFKSSYCPSRAEECLVIDFTAFRTNHYSALPNAIHSFFLACRARGAARVSRLQLDRSPPRIGPSVSLMGWSPSITPIRLPRRKGLPDVVIKKNLLSFVIRLHFIVYVDYTKNQYIPQYMDIIFYHYTYFWQYDCANHILVDREITNSKTTT